MSKTAQFKEGNLYRRSDIHARYGGQHRYGTSTPARWPLIFIFRSEGGDQHGYTDGWHADGTYHITGAGQHGDMQMTAGNRAIRDHAADGKEIHLFDHATGEPGLVRYVGQMRYAGHEIKPVDALGRRRQTIVFKLARVQEAA